MTAQQDEITGINKRSATAAEWAAVNKVLGDGETVVETDTGKQKTGDGITSYSALPYDGANVASGASGPGGLTVADFVFTEGTDPGTYTATLDLPAKSQLWDMWVTMEGDAWAADSALFEAGEPIFGANIFYGTIELGQAGGMTGPYDPTGGDQSGFTGSYMTGSTSGSSILGSNSMFAGVTDAAPGAFFPAGTTVTMTIVTTIASPPVVAAGVLRVQIIYRVADESAASFVAAP